MIMTKILVVDDEEGILELLDENLSDDGFDVISANNGASALAQIYQEQPDIVLLDLNIPEVHGYEVLRELRQATTTKNLPVVLLTGVSPTEGEQAAVELGATHYVTKPWKLASLRAVIRVAMREAGNSGWARPSASQFHDVNQFQVDQMIPFASRRLGVRDRLTRGP